MGSPFILPAGFVDVMTHNPEENATMTGGTGFGLVANSPVIALNLVDISGKEVVAYSIRHQPREVWPGIEGDVAELEKLLK